MDPAVELVNVTKSFGAHKAVDDASFQIGTGEFFSLLGPSGCGKSTTLRMVSGFEAPDAGELRIAGAEMSHVPPFRRPTNMVFQRWALFPHMTVFENVAFGLKVERVGRGELATRVGEMLELVGLQEYALRKPGQLSGGQMQRVALARALVKRPKVLLLDEPLGALDLKLRVQMQLELKRVQAEVGSTFVYVTHDQNEAMTMSDRIAVMNGGRVEQIGSPQDIYDRPASLFVAEFIGNTNIFRVNVDATPAGADKAALGGLTVVLPHGDDPRAGPVHLSVRYERVRLGEDAVPLSNSFEAQVLDVSFTGSTVHYTVRLAGAPLELVAEVTHDAGRPLLHRGDNVQVGWEPASALVLGHGAMDPVASAA